MNGASFRFTAWPDDALQSTAESFLADVDMSDKLRKSVGAMCMQFHSGIRNLTMRYALEAKRHFYITPTSYLQLLNAYKALYAKKNFEVTVAKRRYENGLEKLLFTEEQVLHHSHFLTSCSCNRVSALHHCMCQVAMSSCSESIHVWSKVHA
jgi:hypothetical protein